MAAETNSSSSSAKHLGALRQFSLADIKKATNNFDESLLMRRGGFGEVYKGTFFDYFGTGKTKTIAVKRFNSEVLKCGWFESEMEAWSQFSCHMRIVPVIGYCQESGHNVVLYEYMSNGSLANHLCKNSASSSFSLSWDQCLRICIDAARGLEYMHTNIKHSSGGRYCHADVTATNILFNKNRVAKFSDLYKEPFEGKYMASHFDPYYQSTGKAHRILDVYTFGILLIQVLCRKVSFDNEDENLGIWLHQCIMSGTINQIIHPDMKAQIPLNYLENILFVAGECLDADPKKRPTSTKLVHLLELAMTSSSQRLCHQFSFHQIEKATNNFENILGEGGEGTVYRGEIKKIPVAVKLLKPERSSAFEKEIQILSTFDHSNLVSLVGYCHESDHRVLVYEHMFNGNLQTALRANSLSWEQRLNICIGAARGLRCLHTSTQESPKGVVHRDMKPTNILLDENFNAKISDFGLSKVCLHDQTTSEITTMFKGTIGYYAPEYLQNNKITRRIDVYAFGVILTELLCGKKPWDREHSFYPTDQYEKCSSYSLWAKENVDPHLKGAISPSCLELFTDILEKCLNLHSDARPSMNEVVSVLENALKWQEAWEKNGSGVLFYLPGAEERVVLYYTSNPEREVTSTSSLEVLVNYLWITGVPIMYKRNSKSNSEDVTSTFQDCLRIRLFLRRFGVAIDERDPTKELYAKEFKQVFGNMSNTSLPRVFVRGKYIGGIEIMNKTEELAKLLGVPSPRFVCKDCGEARSCKVCTQEEWYLLCKNCDALTKVIPKEREGDMRSCPHCNGNQFIYKANLETQ